ncbi:hypothetical protein IWW34DRAFT_636081, partial [Fusarium oxysporum f. sp. albedinis]
IWAVLAKIKERDTRNEALENENRCLRKEIEELRERVAVLEKQKDDNEHVEAQTNDNTMALVDVDVELADMREDIRELKAKADSVERGELAEMVKHDVLEYMRNHRWLGENSWWRLPVMADPIGAETIVEQDDAPFSTPKRPSRMVRPTSKVRDTARQLEDTAIETRRNTRQTTRNVPAEEQIDRPTETRRSNGSGSGSSDGRAMLQKALDLLAESRRCVGFSG